MDPIQQQALKGAFEASLTRQQQRPGVREVGKGFSEIFENVMGGADKMQQEAQQSVDGLLKGEVSDIHEVMVAVNKADLSFRFLVEVRNKLMEAYKELMAAK
ncbi:MAG: flagellar hook-basal body complex protein FliE [Planctomycetota bacterium]